MIELKEGWMKEQAKKAIKYYDDLPQWKKDMLPDFSKELEED